MGTSRPYLMSMALLLAFAVSPASAQTKGYVTYNLNLTTGANGFATFSGTYGVDQNTTFQNLPLGSYEYTITVWENQGTKPVIVQPGPTTKGTFTNP